MRSSGKGGKKVQMEQWLGQLETNTSETSERFHFIVLMGQNVIAKNYIIRIVILAFFIINYCCIVTVNDCY